MKSAICYIYKWISLDKLYKLGKLFLIRIRYRIIGQKLKNIQRITRLGLCKCGGGGICADQHAF